MSQCGSTLHEMWERKYRSSRIMVSSDLETVNYITGMKWKWKPATRKGSTHENRRKC